MRTKYLLFGSSGNLSKASELNITEEQNKLERASTYTYLGVTLDEKLNYETHMNQVIKRVSDKLYQLRKIRYFLTTKAALLVYKNMILPMLEYEDVFAVSATLETRERIQKLQNRGLKIALGRDKLYSTKLLHKTTETKMV